MGGCDYLKFEEVPSQPSIKGTYGDVEYRVIISRIVGGKRLVKYSVHGRTPEFEQVVTNNPLLFLPSPGVTPRMSDGFPEVEDSRPSRGHNRT